MATECVHNEQLPGAGQGSWHRAWAVGLGVLVLLTLAVRYAQPVNSTDLWWQMAYGRQCLQNRTLVPDHAAFTWTKVDTGTIYCAWVGEIALYLVHRATGLAGLFALRYAVLAVLVLAVLCLARRLRVLTHPLTWCACIVALLMAQSGALIKPELFSCLFMTLTVLAWFLSRSAGARAWGWCYATPALMLVWANTHGGFIFGVAFVGVVFIGEEVNALYSPDAALPRRTRRHHFFGTALTGCAVLLTPYGLKYPIHLLRMLVAPGESEYIGAVNAYGSIFSAAAAPAHFVELLVLTAVVLVALFLGRLRSGRCDWALLLGNVAFAWLYTRFLRTTFFWAPLAALSVVYLLSHRPRWAWPVRRRARVGLGVAASVVALGLGGRAIHESAAQPWAYQWLGFGVSYCNPVDAAEFVRANLPVKKLGNDYDSGGFLFWTLGPGTKVMIDSRQFPFRQWFEAYRRFESGAQCSAFLKRVSCDVWCIQHRHQELTRWFLRSPDWRLVFYGPVGVVFTRVASDIPALPLTRSGGVGDIKNLTQALRTLIFAANIGDLDGAEKVLAGMRARFRYRRQRSTVAAADDYVAGLRALAEKRYAEAARRLEAAKRSGVFQPGAALTRARRRAGTVAQPEPDVDK